MTKSLGVALLAALALTVVPTVFADDTLGVKEGDYKEKLQNDEAKAKQAKPQAQEAMKPKEEKMKDKRGVEALEKKVEPHY
ncbi:MAG: hypothetical protein HY268_19965 [Deltaproteobacteria bacterium]|nr:hypothetical protein [Deltaproteobacteria bacterium]